jgi:hypothetical protein
LAQWLLILLARVCFAAAEALFPPHSRLLCATASILFSAPPTDRSGTRDVVSANVTHGKIPREFQERPDAEFKDFRLYQKLEKTGLNHAVCRSAFGNIISDTCNGRIRPVARPGPA